MDRTTAARLDHFQRVEQAARAAFEAEERAWQTGEELAKLIEDSPPNRESARCRLYSETGIGVGPVLRQA